MDVCFDLLLPSVVAMEGLVERTAGWGDDVEISPRLYDWGTHVQLNAYPVSDCPAPFVLERLPPTHRDAIRYYVTVYGDGLDLLRSEVNGSRVEWGQRRLLDLLAGQLSSAPRWAVAFMPECDDLGDTCEVDASGLIDKLVQHLRAEGSLEGFFAYSGPA